VDPKHLKAVFVYGTLRPRCGRKGWAGACEVAEASPATVPGKLYLGPGFPYARYLPGSSARITGDVLLCDTTHPAYRHMRSVEINAGYFEVEVPALLITGSTVGALMFNADRRAAHYVHPDRTLPSGDWTNDDEVWEIENLIYGGPRR
jgi:gamma-glutamylcyclotransferase (GGCT)/AIG2-like uncharacterized protein YtfP